MALDALRAGGLLSPFDIQFADCVVGLMGAAAEDDLDLLRVLAAMSSHASFTRQCPCLDLGRFSIEAFFPQDADDDGDGAKASDDSDLRRRTDEARKLISDFLEKDLMERIETLCARLPSAIHLASGPDDIAAFVPMVWHPPRLYLQRFWIYERELAQMLDAKLREPDYAPVPDEEIRNSCRYFQTGKADIFQIKAVELALRKRICVVTGGPGTGKTSIVSVILAKILQETPDAKIALCAPTGKAQARMLESLRDEVGRNLICDEIVGGKIAALPASTIHRLLKYNHGSGKFAHGRENPLAADILVVDEASMVSMPIIVRLLRAVPDHARIVLLGDPEQLASVETGAVLADICEKAACPGSAWSGHVARLSHSHRFPPGSEIDVLKEAVNRGDVELFISKLSSPDAEQVKWGVDGDMRLPSSQEELVESLDKCLGPWRDGILKAGGPAEAMAGLNKFQILCSHRGGMLGSVSLNRTSRKLLGMDRVYGKGVAIMITRNNYEHMLFNGDVGICWPGKDGATRVFFPDVARPGELRPFPPSVLPEHEDAFAMTVHKAQGSGFGEILLVVPDLKDSPILTRELIYTGMTRTKGRATIWASEESLSAAVSRRINRPSGLMDRLS